MCLILLHFVNFCNAHQEAHDAQLWAILPRLMGRVLQSLASTEQKCFFGNALQ